MKRQSLMTALIATSLVLGPSLLAQADKLYKWVDDSGNVTYQDQPPPENVTPEVRNISDSFVSSEDTAAAEIEKSQTAEPVALYSVPDCDVCDVVRVFLSKQGVPFSEKNLGEVDTQQELLKLGGRLEVPTVTVGSRVVTGYRKHELVAVLKEGGHADIDDSARPGEATETDDNEDSSAAPKDSSDDGLTTDSTEEFDVELLPQDEPFQD